MWNAFQGYRDVYGTLPSARTVRRVRLWLIAVNEYEAEQEEARKDAQAKQEEEARRNANRR